MSAEASFVFGTLAAWAGWLFAIRTLYVALLFVFRPAGFDSGRAARAAGISAVASGLMLLVGYRLAPPPAPGAQYHLPAAWLVMPFLGWVAVVLLAAALLSGIKGLLSIQPDARRKAFSAAVIEAGLAGLAWLLFKRTGDPVSLLKGSIDLDPVSAGALALLAVGAVLGMVLSQRAVRLHLAFKAGAAQIALIVGSCVFGLPFAWLLITSFKEDRDMSSPTGLVWIPRVQQTVPYQDPDDPLIESEFRGTGVQGTIVEKYPDGSAKLDILRPMSMRGMTFVAKPPLKEVPKDIPLVTGRFEGQAIKGRVLKELEDGRRRVEVLEPEALKGKTYVALPSEVQPIRNVGLKWTNYPEALEYLPREANKGLTYLKNTLMIVILSVLGTLLSSSVVAYGFARLRFPGKNALFLVLLSTMMLPAAVTLLPTFLIFRGLGWIDTLKPIWVPAFFGSAFNIFLLRQFFMTIPMELEDAAKMDGCGYLRTFWQVMLPQVKPALAVVAIWTFVGAWNNFMGPLVYVTSPENLPISYAVQLFQSERTAEPGYMMAFATMAMTPVLLLFFFAQRYFIEGVTLSGLGGK